MPLIDNSDTGRVEAVELRQVETFRAVAEDLSFSRAAARLG
jgi:hypothetical protein